MQYLKRRYFILLQGDMMRYEVLPYENIRSLRVDAGMTQQQVAEYLNVKQNTYSQYEIGVLNYPVDVLCRLADLYQVSVDYLLGRTDEKTPAARRMGKRIPAPVFTPRALASRRALARNVRRASV